MFRETLKFKIVASDGFSEVEDYLSVHFLLIPTLTILYYVAVGISGFVTVVGIFQKRGIFYGICCKSQYRNGTYYITENKEFLIQIIISKDEMRNGQVQFQNFLQKIKQKKLNLINIVLIDGDIQKFKFNRKKITEHYDLFVPDFQSQSFQQENSFPYTIFKALFCNHIKHKFKKEQNILKKFQSYALQNSDLHKDRWYEFFVQITPVYVEDWYNFTPKIKYQLDTIFKVLRKFTDTQKSRKKSAKKNFKDLNQVVHDQTTSKVEYFDDMHDLEQKQSSFPKLNLPYLFQVLKYQSIGMDPVKYFQVKYTQGQCIIQNLQKINIAKALRKRKSPFNAILSLFNQDYIEIPFNQNQPLPSWCEYRFHHNVIEIFGKLPQNVSEQEKKKDYTIRIEDINGFIMREFRLQQVDDISHCTPQLFVDKMQQPVQRKSKDGTFQIMQEIRKNQKIDSQADKQQLLINKQSPLLNISNILTEHDKEVIQLSQVPLMDYSKPVDKDQIHLEFNQQNSPNISAHGIQINDSSVGIIAQGKKQPGFQYIDDFQDMGEYNIQDEVKDVDQINKAMDHSFKKVGFMEEVSLRQKLPSTFKNNK